MQNTEEEGEKENAPRPSDPQLTVSSATSLRSVPIVRRRVVITVMTIGKFWVAFEVPCKSSLLCFVPVRYFKQFRRSNLRTMKLTSGRFCPVTDEKVEMRV
jgi:hypothetical protein